MRMIAAMIATGIAMTSFGAQAQTARNDSQEPAKPRAGLETLQATVGAPRQKQQVRAQVQARVAAPVTASPLAAWADSTRVGGTSFVDFTRIDQTSHGKQANVSGTGLDVKRFYLSIGHSFNGIWSADLTTDFNYGSVTGETRLFVKKAYLQAAFSKLATLRAGSANLPWISFVEDWYGYRFVEHTLIDRLHFGTSADWGLDLLGDNGFVNYQVSMVGGGGYKHPSRSNSLDFAGRAGIQPIDGLVLALGGYSGDRGKDRQTAPALHDAHRYDAMVAYRANGLRLGVKYFHASNWNTVTSLRADAAGGYSLWGSYDFGPAAVFARYDHARPSKDSDPSLTDTYYNTGVAFPLTRGLRLALAYKDERLVDNAAVNLKTREIGVWGEVKF